MEANTEPTIIAYGRYMQQSKYKVEENKEEFRNCLIRAFRDNTADSIIFDSNRTGQGFTSACAAWAIDNGLLYNDISVDEGQSEIYSFRLTELGKSEILN